MKTKATTVLLGVGAVAAMALLPQGAHAQTSGSGDSGSDSMGGSGPPASSGSGSESMGGSGGPPGGSSGSDSGGGGGPPGGSSGSDSGGGGGPPGGSTSDTEDKVYCANDGNSADYEEYISGEGTTMVRVVSSATGCPNHINWALNPNPAAEIGSNSSIPAYPMLFENGGTTDLSTTANTIGIMRNGVSMYSAWARGQVVTWEDTAFYLEYDSFDFCGGHSTTEGSYHYHGTPGCLQEQAGSVKGQHSKLLGWALDGFPIYGQLGPDGIEMKMCGLEGADDEVCLDGCSGYEGFIDEDEFTYRYYSACGYDESFFPASLNCFRGCCPDGVTCSEKVEACGDNAEIGYTELHFPAETQPLDEQYDTKFIEGDDTELIDSDKAVDCGLYLGSATLESSSSTGSSALETTSSPTSSPTTESSLELNSGGSDSDDASADENSGSSRDMESGGSDGGGSGSGDESPGSSRDMESGGRAYQGVRGGRSSHSSRGMESGGSDAGRGGGRGETSSSSRDTYSSDTFIPEGSAPGADGGGIFDSSYSGRDMESGGGSGGGDGSSYSSRDMESGGSNGGGGDGRGESPSSSQDMTMGDEDDVDEVCPSAGNIAGIESDDGFACCPTACEQCGGPGCEDSGDNCCTSDIVDNFPACSIQAHAPCSI